MRSRSPARSMRSTSGDRRLAFVAENLKRERMPWMYQLDSAIAQPLANTENASSPFWSLRRQNPVKDNVRPAAEHNGESAPADGCSTSADVGNQVLVPVD